MITHGHSCSEKLTLTLNRLIAHLITVSWAALALAVLSASCPASPPTAPQPLLEHPGGASKKLHLRVQHGAGASFQVAITPDGQNVLTSSAGKVFLWETATGRQVRSFQHSGSEEVRALAISANGRYAVTGGWDGNAVLWDITTDQALKHFDNHGEKIDSVAVTANGTHVLTGGWNGSVVLWDALSGKQLRRFSHHRLRVRALALTPDDHFLLTAGDDGMAVLWDLTAGKALRGFSVPGTEITSVAITPNARYIATATRDAARLWDAQSGQLVGYFEQFSPHPVDTVAISADGHFLVTESGRRLVLWDTSTGLELHRFDKVDRISWSMAMTPDGRYLASVGNYGAILWDVTAGKVRRHLKGYSSSVWSVAMTPDQQYLFTGDADGFHRWDIARGLQTQFRARDDIDKHDKGYKDVWSLSLTGDGALVVTAAWGQNAAILWDVATGQELQRFIAEDNVRSVAIDPAGRYIVTGSLHGTAILWDVASGERLHTFDGHSHTVMSVLLLADRDRLITGSSDGTARLWELSSGKELKRFVGHEADVVAMALTADGRQLITDSWDGTARLWDVEKEEEIRRFPGHGIGYAPGRLLFINNGRQLITGDVNGVLRLWDTANFQEIKRFQGHSEEITWLEMSSDERYLITSSLDGTVRIWDLSRGLELCSLVSFNQGSWVVVATDGRFDTDQLDEILGLQWILPDEPLRTYPLELFMRDYYEPNLLSRLLGGEVFTPIRPLTDLNRIQPDVSLISVMTEPCTPQPCVPETVAVTVEVKANEQASGESVQQQSWLTDVYDLRLFRNGQLIAYLPKDRNEMRELSVSTQTDTTQEFNQWRAEHKLSLDPKTLARRITFEHIRLPRLAELDAVEFSVYAFNEDRVKSATARIRCVVSDKEPARSTEGECVLAQPKVRKGRAYVIAVGVNAYENNTWDLKYAAKDAHKLLAVIPPLLEATQEYAAVVPIGLIADWEVVNKQRLVSQQAATKARFKAVLDILADREVDPAMRASIPHVEQLQRAQPEDLVLISYSSHGYADTSGMFYLFPYDIGGKVSKQTMSTLLTRTISSDELSAWLRDVDAGEFVLIIDACHSAASVEGTGFKPGPMGARGLGQLAYDKGMRILASTRADDMALESPMIQQGLLSYALVEDGLIKQRADFAPTDQLIVMKEWLNYSEQRVPELYAQLLQGDVRGAEREQMRLTSFQRGVAMYYDIDKAKAERTRQQPKLFDFRRAPACEVVLTQFAK